MRAGVLSTVAAICAALAFIAIFALPFAQVQTTDHSEDGAVTTETLWLKDAMDADTSAVPGGNPIYLIVATSLLMAGAVAFLVGTRGRTAAMGWVHASGGMVAALGAAMTIHAGALWTGRGLSSLFQRAGGFDGPPLEYYTTYRYYSPSVELYSAFTPVAPTIAMAAAIIAVSAVAFSWAKHVPATRGLDISAHRQAWLVLLGTLVLAIALVAPWTSQVLDDPVPPADGQPHDTDRYLWSPWDVHVIHDATYELASEIGEAGIIQYRGLDLALSTMAVAGILLVVLPMVSIAGSHTAGRGQPVIGRLLENATYLTTGTLAVALGLIVAGTFWLYEANDLVVSTMTGLPLLAVVPAVVAVVLLVRTLRELLAVDTDLVADDYPETVNYE